MARECRIVSTERFAAPIRTPFHGLPAVAPALQPTSPARRNDGAFSSDVWPDAALPPPVHHGASRRWRLDRGGDTHGLVALLLLERGGGADVGRRHRLPRLLSRPSRERHARALRRPPRSPRGRG